MMGLPDCRSVIENSTSLLERSGSTADRLRLQLHVMMCRTCRAFLKQIQQARDAVTGVGDQMLELLDPDLEARLIAQASQAVRASGSAAAADAAQATGGPDGSSSS